VKLKYDPFPPIFAHGDAMIQLACLDFFDLSDSARGQRCLLAAIKRQRADGAFPSRLDPEQWGMQETVRQARLLVQAGLPGKGVNVDGAVQFVLRRQNPDGGWCENPALEIPPQMTWVSGERSITWLTADVVELLRRLGRKDQSPCQAALKWLRAMQNHQGGWPSVADEAAGQEIYGRQDPAFRRGKRLFERPLDACARDAERGYWIRARDGERQEIEVYTLTHLLLSSLVDAPRRLQGGYDMNDPRVRSLLEALVEIQGEDGGWRPFFAEDGSPLYTLLAIEVLVLGGAIPQQDLADLLRPYVD